MPSNRCAICASMAVSPPGAKGADSAAGTGVGMAGRTLAAATRDRLVSTAVRYTRGVHLEGYEVVRRIGRGGTGEVLEAVRVGPGGFRRPVALKRLYGDAAIRGDAVRRFFVEARILAA